MGKSFAAIIITVIIIEMGLYHKKFKIIKRFEGGARGMYLCRAGVEGVGEGTLSKRYEVSWWHSFFCFWRTSRKKKNCAWVNAWREIVIIKMKRDLKLTIFVERNKEENIFTFLKIAGLCKYLLKAFKHFSICVLKSSQALLYHFVTIVTGKH